MPQPFERKLNSRLIFSIIAAGIMAFSGVTVETAMNVTFPTLMQEFGVTTQTVKWMTTSNLLVLALVVPISSYLGKRFKTKHIFIAAMALYLSGIFCGMLAPNFNILLLGRVLEGAGAGVSLPLMFNIITEQAPEKNMGAMMGTGTLVIAVAPAIGPSLGGWLAETFGWRSIFTALLPILLVAFVLGITSISQSHELTRPRFDAIGWLALSGAFCALVFSIDLGASLGWTSLPELGLIALFVVLIALFCWHEGREEHPLIRLSIFGHARFVAGLVALMCIQMIVLGNSFLIPNFAQITHGTGELEAGSILLWGCLVGAAIAPVSGQILDRFGARRPLLFGATCLMVATLLFATQLSWIGVVQMSIIYVLFALGQSLMVGNTMTVSLRELPQDVKADGNATINTLQQLFGALGTATASNIVNAAQLGAADMAAATFTGTQTAFVVMAAIACVPVMCMVLLVGKTS
ncbi:MAG: MFS transporter [Atopobiaceae bacterium]